LESNFGDLVQETNSLRNQIDTLLKPSSTASSNEEEEEEVHVARLESDDDENSDDDDRELQAAYSSGLLKPGIFKSSYVKPQLVNNVEGLLEKLKEIKQTDLGWVERMDVTIGKDQLKEADDDGVDESKITERDVHNDFKREVHFYKQAQQAVITALEMLHSQGVKTKRPDDYFAQMAKSDDHMKRMKQKLLVIQKKKETHERNKINFQLRKYGKKVQNAVAAERQDKKKKMMNNVKSFQKGKLKDLDFLDDDTQAQMKKKPSQLEKLQKQMSGSKLNGRRAKRDQKFGYGGKKKGQKRNTNQSLNNIKSKGSKKQNKRLGKSRRVKGKK
jgi:rRNA-processing protein EBP2